MVNDAPSPASPARLRLMGRWSRGSALSDDDFDTLYRDSWQRLVRLAALLVGDATAAEDIVQDAFANVYRRWGRLYDLPGAGAYTRTAVINGSRSFLRRRGTAGAARGLNISNAEAADVAVIGVEDQGAMRRAVISLPPRQREVLVLRYWAELAEAEIAQTLRVSRGTVKSSAARGLAALSKVLEASHGD